MASRPVWKGQLRLSLVAIPVEMYSATNSRARVSFRQIHKPSGQPVRYEKTVPGIGPVDNDDIWKGYEIEKDEYVLIDPDEIDAIKLESKKTLELVQFVDITDIPPIYFDKPYFLSPTDELAEDAFRVVRDALRETGKAGLGQLAMRGQEHLVAVRPCGSGLLLETLHYADEIRKTDTFFSTISAKKAEKDLLGVAKELISQKSAPFDADNFTDRYANAINELVKSKSGKRGKRGRPDTTPAGTGKDNVVDLMSALKKSVEKSSASASERSGKSSGKKSSTSSKRSA